MKDFIHWPSNLSSCIPGKNTVLFSLPHSVSRVADKQNELNSIL